MIEDDYDSEYRYDRAPVGTLQRLAPDRVVYLGTTSKTLAPALRLGWLVAPPALAAEVARERWAVDSGGPAINARAYARLLATGEVDRHLRRTRREYRERRDALVAAFEAGSRTAASRVWPPGCTCCCGSRRARTRRRSSRVSRSAGFRIRGLAGYRLTPRPDDPALVIGYGRLPLASIDAFAEQLVATIG